MNSPRCFLNTKIQARTACAHSARWTPGLERPPPSRERLPRPLCFKAVPSQPYQMLSPEPRSEGGGVLTHLLPASPLLPRQAPSPKRKHLDTLSLAKLIWKFSALMRLPEEGEPLPPHLSCHPWYPTCLDRRDSPRGKRQWKGNELFPATEVDSEHRIA